MNNSTEFLYTQAIFPHWYTSLLTINKLITKLTQTLKTVNDSITITSSHIITIKNHYLLFTIQTASFNLAFR